MQMQVRRSAGYLRRLLCQANLSSQGRSSETTYRCVARTRGILLPIQRDVGPR